MLEVRFRDLISQDKDIEELSRNLGKNIFRVNTVPYIYLQIDFFKDHRHKFHNFYPNFRNLGKIQNKS